MTVTDKIWKRVSFWGEGLGAAFAKIEGAWLAVTSVFVLFEKSKSIHLIKWHKDPVIKRSTTEFLNETKKIIAAIYFFVGRRNQDWGWWKCSEMSSGDAGFFSRHFFFCFALWIHSRFKALPSMMCVPSTPPFFLPRPPLLSSFPPSLATRTLLRRRLRLWVGPWQSRVLAKIFQIKLAHVGVCEIAVCQIGAGERGAWQDGIAENGALECASKWRRRNEQVNRWIVLTQS